jgi:hypothetical protein
MRQTRLVPALAVTLSLCGGCATPAPAQQAPDPDAPPLLVLLVVDQFRADYVQEYGDQWTAGLRRLLDEGAVFPDAAYTFASTKTCAGHVTIGTGTVPMTHGMIDNSWYDRAASRSRACTDDGAVEAIAIGDGESSGRHGPGLMRARTLADQLRARSGPGSRVVSIALKARSAIGLGGHGGEGAMVLWKEGDGVFGTSSAYTSAPWPEADRFVRAHPIDAARDEVWTRLLPADAYRYDDDAPGEGGGRVFPHPFSRPDDDPWEFVGQWERSPWSDEYLADMGMALAGDLDLGGQGGTDMLAIGFSALDLIGHTFGPRSHEVQDTLVRLDRTIGRLLDWLDAEVGAGRYVVALSSDHGVPALPEQADAIGVRAGRLTSGDIRRVVNAALEPHLGEGRHVANISSPFVYFAPEVAARVAGSPELRTAVTQALIETSGIAAVYWADAIGAEATTHDQVLVKLRRSFVPERSGDVAVVLEPHWVPQANGTTHGSPHPYDTRVPLVLFGAGIAPGHYPGAAAPVDIAPTLATLIGLTLEQTDGRVLGEALAARR